MDMIGYLGKKVNIICVGGEKFSGYVFDVLKQDESDIGEESIELDPIDRKVLIEIPIREIKDVKVDNKYKEFDFRR